MRNIKMILATVLLVMTPVMVSAQGNVSLDQLLEKTRQGRAADNKDNQQRIRDFTANRAQQAELLKQAKAQRASEERRSQNMEKEFDENDLAIIALEGQLQDRLGSLKELFGVLQQAAGDARGQFENSVTQVQYPERTEFLTQFAQKMGQSNRLASLEEIERLWFELQREMTESSKTVTFPTMIIAADGEEVQRDVTRIGLFNVVSDGKYLRYDPDNGKLFELGRQPQARFTSKIPALENAKSGMVPLAVDPSRGQILGLLVEAPNLRERIDQGGVIGYIIIALGIVALLVALERLISLFIISGKVRSQQKNPENPGNNPLGRILSVYQENKTTDLETMELKLGEAILKEMPKLNRFLVFLKIIAVVAPLMGLLGTVTGMIVTFQQITLFGTGDPKLMAGGISQALVTTVLGLCVAIPTVFLHTLVATRAKRVNQVLQEQAAGMIARQAEQKSQRT